MSNDNTIEGCGCPIMTFQRMISGKYKVRILWDLRDGPRRYGEIRNGLRQGAGSGSTITPRVLSRELKALAEVGLVDRRDYRLAPPKVEYSLTSLGESFIPVIANIRDWGSRNLGAA